MEFGLKRSTFRLVCYADNCEDIMMRNLFKKTTSLLIVATIVITLASSTVHDIYAMSSNSSNLPEAKSTILGENVVGNSLATIDYSNLSEGYIFVSYNGGTNKPIKVQILKNGRTTGWQGHGYLYRINNHGVPEQLVLSEGNGTYTVNVFRHANGAHFNLIFSTTFNVTLRHELAPFLYPNKYVNFTLNGAVSALAATLAEENYADTVRRIFRYVSGNISYNWALVSQGVPSWYEPNLEELLETRLGICFDFASLMTALLRLNGIPAKMVFGYFEGDSWHAWVNVYLPEYGWLLLDPTKNIGDSRIVVASMSSRRPALENVSFDAVQFF